MPVRFNETVYHEGLASNRQQNWTDFYCNSERTALWGNAVHRLDLKGGLLTLPNGVEIPYGLGPVPDDPGQ